MTGKLVFLSKGYRVVPEELPYDDMRNALIANVSRAISGECFLYSDMWSDIIKAAPSIDTPPVLRWEGVMYENASALLLGWHEIVRVSNNEQARRAAEKALGLPEIEEV